MTETAGRRHPLSGRATEFEFRNRFWIISGTFCLGFSCYVWDHMNMSVALARMILGGLNSPLADRWIRAIFAVGVLLVTLGALVRSWAAAYLHSSVVHDSELHSDRLVADGPYRRVRNPLYLGNILLAVGLGLMASRTGFVCSGGRNGPVRLPFDPARGGEPAGIAGRWLSEVFRDGPAALAFLAPARPSRRGPAQLGGRLRRRNLHVGPGHWNGGIRCHSAPVAFLDHYGRRLRGLFLACLAAEEKSGTLEAFSGCAT